LEITADYCWLTAGKCPNWEPSCAWLSPWKRNCETIPKWIRERKA